MSQKSAFSTSEEGLELSFSPTKIKSFRSLQSIDSSESLSLTLDSPKFSKVIIYYLSILNYKCYSYLKKSFLKKIKMQKKIRY